MKNRTLANLSRWPKERIEALRRALKGEFDLLPLQPTPRSGPIFGVLFALRQVAEQIGIVAAVGRHHVGSLALFLVLARVAGPGSRLAAARWAREHATTEVLGLDKIEANELYEVLDTVAEKQSVIEERLYQSYLKRCARQAPTLVLYDVTVVWLEGAQNELAAWGRPGHAPPGTKIVLVGLLTDRQGEPLAIRVFEGNRADPSTVAEQLRILSHQFGIEDVVFVGDRGMIRGKAKEALDTAGFLYITALSQPEIRRLLRRGVIQLGLFDEAVVEVTTGDGRRLVLRRNAATQRKEHHRRLDKLGRLRQRVDKRNAFVGGSPRAKPQAGLARLRRWMADHKLTAFARLELKERELRLDLDEQRLAEAEALHGCYVIATNARLSLLDKDGVHEAYLGLQGVERDFRLLKTVELELRPVFVRKASRTRGHALIAMLALKLVRELNRRLAGHYGTTNEHALTVTLEDSLLMLSRLTLDEYTLAGGEVLTMLPRPDERQQELLAAIGVPLPSLRPPRRAGNTKPRRRAREASV